MIYNQKAKKMNERYENISKMNDILLRLEGILTNAEALLEEWKAIQPEYEALDEVPQWVLTQDAIFDAIGTQFDIADSFQPLLDRINSRKWKE